MSQVCQATYSNVPVWVFNANGVSVMRRQEDGWVNATHLLKVADFDKPRRTRILERDVQTGEHEKVQGGYGKYQGTWVPLERARILAKEFGVYDAVHALLDYVAKDDGTVLPSAARIPARRQPSTADAPAKKARKSASMPSHAQAEAQARRPRATKTQSLAQNGHPHLQPIGFDQPHGHELQGYKAHDQSHTMGLGQSGSRGRSYGPDQGDGHGGTRADSVSSSPLSSTSGFLSDDETMGGNQTRWDTRPNPSGRYGAGAMRVDNGKMNGQYFNEHSASLLEFFMAPDRNKIPDIILNPHPDFHVNQPIDDEGHTPFHWAAAMGLIKVMEALIDAGADPAALNYAGHTPLARAVHFTNNYDIRSFPQVLELLKDTLFYVDSQGMTVLHHAAFTASSRSKVPSSRYYVELALAKMTESRGLEFANQFISHTDINQDTALHIAARNGSRKLVKLFLSYNAPANIPNRSGRTAHEYILEYETHRRQMQPNQASSSPPSIYTRRPVPPTPIARHLPSPHVSEAAIMATQQVAGQMADHLEELAQTYDADLKDRDTDIEQVRQLLTQVKRNTSENQRQIPELQKQLGSEEQINQEIRQASELVEQRSRQLQVIVERTQARDLALTVQKEETDVQEALKQQLAYREFDIEQSVALARQLQALQNGRREIVREIVELYATAGSGDRMNEYRKLVSLSCGADINEIDGLLDGIAQALGDKQ